MQKALKLFEQFLQMILVLIVLGFFFACYFFEIRFTKNGMHIGRFALFNEWSAEGIVLSYQETHLIVTIENLSFDPPQRSFSDEPVSFPHIEVYVHNGLVLGDQPLHFSASWHGTGELEMVIEKRVKARYSHSGEVWVECDQLPLNEMKRWGALLYDHPAWQWVSGGTVHGSVGFDLEARALLKGDLMITDLQGGDPVSGGHFFMEKVSLRDDHKVEIHNGSVCVVEPEDGYDFGMEHLSGLVWGDYERGLKFDLEGVLRQGADTYPIFLEGARGEQTILEADASLLLDQGSNLKRYFHISIENPIAEFVIVKGRFNHVVESEYRALKQLFKPDIPFLETLHVDSMQLSFEMKGIWDRGHFVSISAEDILGDCLISFHGEPIIPLKIEARYSETGLFTGKIQDGLTKGILELSVRGKEGEFKGTNLSDALLNSFLTPFRDGWSLEGSANIGGKLVEGSTTLTLDATNLSFIDKYVRFCLTKQPLHGEFSVANGGAVQGKLFCQEGELEVLNVLSTPMVFNQLKSCIEIQGDTIHLKEIKALYEGIALEGELSLLPLTTGEQRLRIELSAAEGPLEGLKPWMQVPEFLQGTLQLKENGAFFEIDLLAGATPQYGFDLCLKDGELGPKEEPFTHLEVHMNYSSVEQKGNFDFLLRGEAVDWCRFVGGIDQGFCFFDAKNTQLFQRPFKQLQGGEGEGGIAFTCDAEEMQVLATLFRLDLPWKAMEIFVGFRDFGEVIAANIRLDDQETSLIKNGPLWTLKKGDYKLGNTQIHFDDLILDTIQKTVTTTHFQVTQDGIDVTGHLAEGRLFLKKATVFERQIELVDPSQVVLDREGITLQAGRILVDQTHTLSIGALTYNLWNQEISLKSSKLEWSLGDLFPVFSTLSGWVRGEWKEGDAWLEYTMTPFTADWHEQKLQVDRLVGVWEKQGFKISMEGNINRLHCKSVLQSHPRDWKRVSWSIESDLGHAFFDVEYDPNISWVVHETKGDLLGLVWSLSPYQKLRDPEKMALVGSLMLDPSLFAQGLNTFKIPVSLPIEVEKPLQLQGVVTFWRDLQRFPSLEGVLLGRYLKVEGIGVRNLSMQVHFADGLLEIKKVRLVDPAFDLSIESAKVDLETRDLLLEGILLVDAKPAAILKKGEKDPFTIQELVIPTFLVQTKKGLSLKGRGELSFINREKRSKNLLDLPRELLAVLGLDLNLLVPVIGEIEFSFEGDRLYFEKLRRTYSQEDRSSFFLDPKQVSSIGLDGSVAIYLRMKQSALLRLAEPFVIAIEGSLETPSISLR